MSSHKAGLQATAIQQQCKLLRLPAVGSQCAGLAELAVKEKQSHLDYLEALLAAELEERERNTVARRGASCAQLSGKYSRQPRTVLPSAPT